MSVFYPVGGTAEEPISLRPDDTAVNDLLELSANQEISVIGLIVVNEDTANPQFASIWYTIGADDFLIFNKDIPAGDSVHEILQAPIRLVGKFGTRKIKVQAETADQVTFTVIYSATNAQFANS